MMTEYDEEVGRGLALKLLYALQYQCSAVEYIHLARVYNAIYVQRHIDAA